MEEPVTLNWMHMHLFEAQQVQRWMRSEAAARLSALFPNGPFHLLDR